MAASFAMSRYRDLSRAGALKALASRQQAKDGNTICGRDEYLSVGDDRDDKFIACAKLVASAGCLIAVVQFSGEVGRRVGVEHRRRSVLICPDNGIRRAIRRDDREGSGVGELRGTLRGRRVREQRI